MSAKVHLDRALAALRIDRHDLALVEAEKALALEISVKGHVFRARALQELKRYEEAVAAARAAVALDPESYAAWQQLAFTSATVSYRTKAWPEGSLEAIRKTISFNPEEAEIWMLLGDYEHDHGQATEAMASFKRSIGLDPSSELPVLRLTALLIELKRYEECAALALEKLALHPSCVDLMNNASFVLWIIDRRVEALEPMKQQTERAFFGVAAAYAVLAAAFGAYLVTSGAWFRTAHVTLGWVTGRIEAPGSPSLARKPSTEVLLREGRFDGLDFIGKQVDANAPDAAVTHWRSGYPDAREVHAVVGKRGAFTTWRAIVNDDRLYRLALEARFRDHDFISVGDAKPVDAEALASDGRRRWLGGLALDSAVMMLAIAPALAPLSAGLRARRRRLQTERLVATMQGQLEGPLADVARAVGCAVEQLEPLVRHANASGVAFFAVDGRTQAVVDGRLLTAFVAGDDCVKCGAPSARSLPLVGERLPACERCGEPVGLEAWRSLKSRYVARLLGRPEAAAAPVGRRAVG